MTLAVIVIFAVCLQLLFIDASFLNKLNPEIFDKIIPQWSHFERLQFARTGRQARSLITDYYKYNGLDERPAIQMSPYEHVNVLTMSSEEQRNVMVPRLRETRIQLMHMRRAFSKDSANEADILKWTGWLHNAYFYIQLLNITESSLLQSEIKDIVGTLSWLSTTHSHISEHDRWSRAIAHFQKVELMSKNGTIYLSHHDNYRRDMFAILEIESWAELESLPHLPDIPKSMLVALFSGGDNHYIITVLKTYFDDLKVRDPAQVDMQLFLLYVSTKRKDILDFIMDETEMMTKNVIESRSDDQFISLHLASLMILTASNRQSARTSYMLESLIHFFTSSPRHLEKISRGINSSNSQDKSFPYIIITLGSFVIADVRSPGSIDDFDGIRSKLMECGPLNNLLRDLKAKELIRKYIIRKQ